MERVEVDGLDVSGDRTANDDARPVRITYRTVYCCTEEHSTDRSTGAGLRLGTVGK